jgi:hypothetical protein
VGGAPLLSPRATLTNLPTMIDQIVLVQDGSSLHKTHGHDGGELAGTYSREINCGHAEGENDDDGTEDVEDTAFRLNANHGLNIREIPQSAKDKRAITLCASTPIARAFSLPSSLDGNDRARNAAHCKQRPQARLTRPTKHDLTRRRRIQPRLLPSTGVAKHRHERHNYTSWRQLEWPRRI